MKLCPHTSRKQITDPETGVKQGRLLSTTTWFCYDCGTQWDVTKSLGKVAEWKMTVTAEDAMKFEVTLE